MLRATHYSNYRKNGRLACVYTVTGTVAELTAYANAKSEATGVPVDQLQKSTNGQHLFHLFPDAARGITADKTLNLVITTNNRVVVDNGEKAMAEINEDAVAIRQARNTAIGQGQAQIALGLVSAAPVRNTSSSPAITAPDNTKQNDDVADAVEELAGEIVGETMEQEGP